MSRADERQALERAVEAWGDAPAPAPDGAFVHALGRRLTSDDGAVEVVLGPGGSSVVPFRRRAGIAAVAAAAALFVAGAAAAVVGTARDDAPPSASTAPSSASDPTIAVVPTTAPPPLTSTAPVVSISPLTAPVTSTVAPTTPAPTTVPEPTSTQPPAPATTRSPPSATTVVPAPTTRPPEPTTTVPASPPPPSTTTTEVRVPASLAMTCVAQSVDARPAIVCEWSEEPGVGVQYRLLRNVVGSTVGRSLSPSAGTRRYVDFDVAAGSSYRYLAQAFTGSTIGGNSNPVIVAR